jgi:tetratricopeptide (TPR) repeat protein
MAISSTPEQASRRVQPRPGGLFLRIALLVAAPILFLGALEGSLRLFGIGKPTEFFIPDRQEGYFRTNPNFTSPFMPASFGIQPLNFRIRKHKEPKSIRVFVLGESAAQGVPDPAFGFAAQLRAQLRARFHGMPVEVFNLGITAIDSHVVYRIVRQVADFEPDLFVVYMGNNEVVGPYGPGCAYLSTTPPVWLIRASVAARATRTGQLLEDILARVVPSRSRARDWKGMETFSESSVSGDDPRLEAVYGNFSANLQDIVDFARAEGIKTVLATVVANLRDSAPFISLHRAGMPAAESASWKSASDAGTIAWDLGDPESARFDFDEALKADPEFAAIHFRQGNLSEELGDTALARRHYLEALHWDALRFRPDARINEIIRRIGNAAGGSVVLVDAAKAMGSDPDSNAPPSGREILFDHVHFNWAGNFQLALQLADACERALSLPASQTGDWLDASGCAAALGYTPEAELKMLQVMVQLMIRPPFTTQLNFSENQARLKKDIEHANARIGAPGAKSADIEVVERALRLDPDNAALAARLGVMESGAGDQERALSLLRRADELEPESAEAAIRTAEVLMRMKRFDEAEALLVGSLRQDAVYFSGSKMLVELWTATKQFEKGKAFLADALSKVPSNSYLRLEYANLLARSGDSEGAEREARTIWNADPASRQAMAALEMLVRLYGRLGRTADAEALTLDARNHQAGDYYNNERLVRIFTSRNDPAGVAESLRALAASGPFDSAEHLEFAHRLADLNKGPEMLGELAQARAVAQVEGSAGQIQAINDVIAGYRRRFSDGQAR